MKKDFIEYDSTAYSNNKSNEDGASKYPKETEYGTSDIFGWSVSRNLHKCAKEKS